MNDLEDLTATTDALLRDWCALNHIRIMPDDAVSEGDASLLCGYEDRSQLARRIGEGLPVPRYRTVPGKRERRFYRVADCAAWLASQYSENGGF